MTGNDPNNPDDRPTRVLIALGPIPSGTPWRSVAQHIVVYRTETVQPEFGAWLVQLFSTLHENSTVSVVFSSLNAAVDLLKQELKKLPAGRLQYELARDLLDILGKERFLTVLAEDAARVIAKREGE